MLNGGYKIELQNGIKQDILLADYRYCPHFRCFYISYFAIDKPDTKNIVPLKEVAGKLYLDYSFKKEELNRLAASFSIGQKSNKLPKELLIDPLDKKIKEEKELLKDKVIDLEEELPKRKESTKKEVIATTPVKVESTDNKRNVLYIRCQDKKMIFLVEKENSKYYECREISYKDFEKNKDNYNVLYSTFSVIDYYTLEGTKNITSKNGVNTKIDKKKVIDDNIPVHGIIISYLKGFTALFLIKNVLDDKYEIEYTTYDYIKNKPFDLIKKEFTTKEEFLKFYNDFVESRDGKKPLYIKKSSSPIFDYDDLSIEGVKTKSA